MIGTRYRIGVTRRSAAEFELGIGRLEASGCLIAISDGSHDACGDDRTTLFSARAEIGRRFNGDGGATHFMAGFEFDMTGR